MSPEPKGLRVTPSSFVAPQEELGEGLVHGDVALVAVGVDVGEIVGYGVEPDLLGAHAARAGKQASDHVDFPLLLEYRKARGEVEPYIAGLRS